MVDTQNQFSLAKFQDSIGVVTTRSMKPLGKEQTSQIKTSSRIEEHESVGWISRQKSSRFPVKGEVFS
jgi:hypothetical protein